MFYLAKFHRERMQAYMQACVRKTTTARRWMVGAGGVFIAFAGIWSTLQIGAPVENMAGTSAALLAWCAVLFVLTFAEAGKKYAAALPVLFALAAGAYIGSIVAFGPLDGAGRFAFLAAALTMMVVLMAPTLPAAMAGLVAVAVTLGGSLAAFPPQNTWMISAEAAVYLIVLLILAMALAIMLEISQRRSFALEVELERRATTDELSGVSNRGHITLLAHNEFARARRYREPFSAMMLEIDGLDGISGRSGHAAAVVVQMFAGYCVVVMRHCDSFGRLARHRFLALLPETPGPGAHTLALRMCRDLARLDVIAAGEKLGFTVSIGVAAMEAQDRVASDMLRRAEQALDDAIDKGRNNAILSQLPAASAVIDAITAATDPPAP